MCHIKFRTNAPSLVSHHENTGHYGLEVYNMSENEREREKETKAALTKLYGQSEGVLCLDCGADFGTNEAGLARHMALSNHSRFQLYRMTITDMEREVAFSRLKCLECGKDFGNEVAMLFEHQKSENHSGHTRRYKR